MSFEPVEIEKLLKQSVPVCNRIPLNVNRFADYYWICIDGHASQLERKQWNELLSEFDEIEEQLRRYLDSTQEMGLIIEGLLMPHEIGCETWAIEPNGYVRRKQIWKRHYSEVLAWLWQLDKQGITVYQTPHYAATAASIAAFYHNSQKEEHTTLRRYIKAKPAAWIPNLQIQNLINIRGVKLGEKTATALIDKYHTVWGVLTRGKDELCEVEGVGMKTAEALFRAIGKE